jgi:hypothetical protein
MSRRLAAGLLLLAGCTGPRSVLLSPEAVPRGQWRLGATLEGNLPTATSGALYGGLEAGAEALYDRVRASDTAPVPISADSLNLLARPLIAYSLDPLGAGASFHARYGIWDRVDAGYRYAGGAHVFDARLQFLGPLAGGADGWRGSVAVQYSGQDYELPSFLGHLQSILKYELKRKDVLVPLVFGKPLGAGGRFGDFGLGAAYNLTFLEYDSGILRLVEKADGTAARPFAPIRGERAVHAYGGFANARLGYRWAFLLLSLAAYVQDYGSFALFAGEEASLSGWTFAPSAGLEFRF